MTKILNFIACTTTKEREKNDIEQEQTENKNVLVENKNMTVDRRMTR